MSPVAELSERDALRRAARGVRQQVMSQLPALLDRFADAVLDRGAHVCWAPTAADARHYVAGLVVRHNARRVVKATSMVTEEIDIDRAVDACQAQVVDTDLGEWIVRLADEAPSHVLGPDGPRAGRQLHDLLIERAGTWSTSRSGPDTLVRFARERLRDEFLHADIGITGANLAVAETGSLVLVTDEGNARLVPALPRVHVVVLAMDRLAADWAQADLLLTLLARSTTGQRLSSSTSVLTGPRHRDERDGPDELHVVILDNGRSQALGIEPHDVVACVRCGAALDRTILPLHARSGPRDAGELGWSGPLENTSTLCGACLDACLVELPLQDLLLSLRRTAPTRAGWAERAAWRLWAAAWSDARRYGLTTRSASWGRWATRLADHLPVASVGVEGRQAAAPSPTAARFRDLWWRGRV
jgi:L-lactate dehydrogenase complex protein LldF